MTAPTVVLFPPIPCCFPAIPSCSLPFPAVPRCSLAFPCHGMPFPSIPCWTVPFFAVRRCSVLYPAVPLRSLCFLLYPSFPCCSLPFTRETAFATLRQDPPGGAAVRRFSSPVGARMHASHTAYLSWDVHCRERTRALMGRAVRLDKRVEHTNGAREEPSVLHGHMQCLLQRCCTC